MFLYFVGVGFNSYASVTLYCRVLRTRPDNTMVDRKWATAENGGLGGLAGDVMVYPQLAPMSHATATGVSGHLYWPSRYGPQSNSPVVYNVQAGAPNIVIPDDRTNQIDNIVNTIEHNFPTAANRCAINSISVSFDSEGTPVISATTYNLGYKVAGTGVSTSDASGNAIISYPDSTGFVPGYEPIGPDGSFVPVYYDPNQVSNGYALRLNSLESIAGNKTLSFDSDTGLYSFEVPDYSTQLQAIQLDLNKIANKELVIDNIRLELPPDFDINVPPPEVTVNPQVTVNPTVTVTPDVTVNVTAPSQNDITVAIDSSSIVNAINDASWENWTQLGDIETNTGNLFDYIQPSDVVSDFDTSTLTLSQEEQGLINIVEGWNTQIPVISNACDFALNSIFGSIPTIPPADLSRIVDLNALGFRFVIDLSPYSSYFIFLRAFCLLLEVIWFINSIWRAAIQTLQV